MEQDKGYIGDNMRGSYRRQIKCGSRTKADKAIAQEKYTEIDRDIKRWVRDDTRKYMDKMLQEAEKLGIQHHQ